MSLLASIQQWLPDSETIFADLGHIPSFEEDKLFYATASWKGMSFKDFVLGRSEGGEGFFSATYWSGLTARHWEVPLACVGLYLIIVPTLQLYVVRYGRYDVRNIALFWNAFLSIYSWLGVFACVPTIIWSLTKHGLYFTTCAPAGWYGTGICGLFVALFIYSKIAELVDTILLILAGRPIVVLQWWHHSTVLLYCWHSYAVRIATGAWFAGMNYTVHSLMYGYFALMGSRYRKVVAPFAIYITMLQLLQMVVGMFVTVNAVLYQTQGVECHVNRTNSVLGLTMYASYFVLFAKLFVENYVLKHRQRKDQDGKPKSAENLSEFQCKMQPIGLTMYARTILSSAKLFVHIPSFRRKQMEYKPASRHSVEKPAEAQRGVQSASMTKEGQAPIAHENTESHPNLFGESEVTSTVSPSSGASSLKSTAGDVATSSTLCQEDGRVVVGNLVKRRKDRS